MSSTQPISPRQTSPAAAGASKRTRPVALALTGVALIAILFGFAMSVMPHLSAGGKIAAVVLQAGVATTVFALLCQSGMRKAPLDQSGHSGQRPIN